MSNLLTLDEIADETKILKAKRDAIDSELILLAMKKEEIKKRDFLAIFREMVKPIIWSPELTENLKTIKLTAWVNTYEEQAAKFEVIKQLGLSDSVKMFCLPGGVQMNLDYGDLYITINHIEHLQQVVGHYGLNVVDCSGTIQEIDEKVAALNWLKSILSVVPEQK